MSPTKKIKNEKLMTIDNNILDVSEFGAQVRWKMKNCDLLYYNYLEREIKDHTYSHDKRKEFDPLSCLQNFYQTRNLENHCNHCGTPNRGFAHLFGLPEC